MPPFMMTFLLHWNTNLLERPTLKGKAIIYIKTIIFTPLSLCFMPSSQHTFPPDEMQKGVSVNTEALITHVSLINHQTLEAARTCPRTKKKKDWNIRIFIKTGDSVVSLTYEQDWKNVSAEKWGGWILSSSPHERMRKCLRKQWV